MRALSFLSLEPFLLINSILCNLALLLGRRVRLRYLLYVRYFGSSSEDD